MQLLKKFPALRLGDLQFRGPFGQRPEGVQTVKP